MYYVITESHCSNNDESSFEYEKPLFIIDGEEKDVINSIEAYGSETYYNCFMSANTKLKYYQVPILKEFPKEYDNNGAKKLSIEYQDKEEIDWYDLSRYDSIKAKKVNTEGPWEKIEPKEKKVIYEVKEWYEMCGGDPDDECPY